MLQLKEEIIQAVLEATDTTTGVTSIPTLDIFLDDIIPQKNQQIVTELNQFYDDTIEDYILWDKKENGPYPIDRIHQALKSFINKLSN
jgi:altronate dehydratase